MIHSTPFLIYQGRCIYGAMHCYIWGAVPCRSEGKGSSDAQFQLCFDSDSRLTPIPANSSWFHSGSEFSDSSITVKAGIKILRLSKSPFWSLKSLIPIPGQSGIIPESISEGCIGRVHHWKAVRRHVLGRHVMRPGGSWLDLRNPDLLELPSRSLGRFHSMLVMGSRGKSTGHPVLPGRFNRICVFIREDILM